MSDLITDLSARSNLVCELCKATDPLVALPIPPDAVSADRHLHVCEVCFSQVNGELDEKHWFCLKECIWSEIPAVQVVGVRLLRRLPNAVWAQDLLEQTYLSDDVQSWVDAGGASDEEVTTLDSNGTRLTDGDSVTLIKDLDVKGAGFVAKRGTMVKGIRLIGDPDNIEGRVNKTMLVLKTKFLKKA